MKEKTDDLVEQLLADLMDACWIRINEGNEMLKELDSKQNIKCDQMTSVLKEKAPELIPVFDDYQSAFMEKEAEEDRAIYIQGAKDLVYLFKKIGVICGK